MARRAANSASKLLPGWRVEPSELPVELNKRGASHDYQFNVTPSSLKEGRAEIHAVLEAGGKKFSEGYSLVTREDLGLLLLLSARACSA